MAAGAPATLNISSGIQSHRFLFNTINIRTNLILPIRHPFSSPSSVLTFARRSNKAAGTPVSTQKSGKKKKNPPKELSRGVEEEEEDAFEALFRQLEEDLKNDGLSLDDEDDDISEEDLAKLERELEEALKDDELFGALGLTGDAKEDDDDDETEEEEGATENAGADYIANHDDQDTEEEGEQEEDEDEEMPVQLRNWQRKKLAYALKSGRRKTSIKNLAAELCLDRAIVLQLLRDPPPDLLMLSATLPDKPASTVIEPVNHPTETDPLETASEISKPEPEPKAASVKLPVHVRQNNWSANKRIKKAQLDTLELVYRRSKRPTNAMISNIVHVTNLPRKKVLKWFEDKRGEEGVPDRRVPFQRSPSAFT